MIEQNRYIIINNLKGQFHKVRWGLFYKQFLNQTNDELWNELNNQVSSELWNQLYGKLFSSMERLRY